MLLIVVSSLLGCGYTDVRSPSCVRLTGRQRVLMVNRTTAYRRSEGRSIVVRLGPYSARLRPQQAALFERPPA